MNPFKENNLELASKEKGNSFPSVFSLKGKTAIITGGSMGIGFQIARCMAMAGATVLITGRREEALKKAITNMGDNADYLVNDVTQLDQLEAMVAKVEEKYGGIDILPDTHGAFWQT